MLNNSDDWYYNNIMSIEKLCSELENKIQREDADLKYYQTIKTYLEQNKKYLPPEILKFDTSNCELVRKCQYKLEQAHEVHPSFPFECISPQFLLHPNKFTAWLICVGLRFDAKHDLEERYKFARRIHQKILHELEITTEYAPTNSSRMLLSLACDMWHLRYLRAKIVYLYI